MENMNVYIESPTARRALYMVLIVGSALVTVSGILIPQLWPGGDQMFGAIVAAWGVISALLGQMARENVPTTEPARRALDDEPDPEAAE